MSKNWSKVTFQSAACLINMEPLELLRQQPSELIASESVCYSATLYMPKHMGPFKGWKKCQLKHPWTCWIAIFIDLIHLGIFIDFITGFSSQSVINHYRYHYHSIPGTTCPTSMWYEDCFPQNKVQIRINDSSSQGCISWISQLFPPSCWQIQFMQPCEEESFIQSITKVINTVIVYKVQIIWIELEVLGV